MTNLHPEAVAILEEFANHESWAFREAVARREYTPAHILEWLAKDDNAQVATQAKAQLYDRLTQQNHEKTT